MADKITKPTAQSSSAGVTKEVAAGPLQWSDKCFLCGKEIGETDPRGFYQGTAAMMLCHRGCLNVMATHGGTPADYHRATSDPAPQQAHGGNGGPSWMEFPDLTALQSYTKSQGDIPATVKVTVAGQVIQEGQ
jgi:hypothetical protein